MNDTKKKILEFLNAHDCCVIATTDNDGKPEAATVGFSATDDLKLTIGTYRGTRKFANLQTNSKVAVVVGFSGDITIQYEGVARELTEPKLSERLKVHHAKLPSALKYRDHTDQTYLLIDPTWIRYTNYANNPDVEELREFA